MGIPNLVHDLADNSEAPLYLVNWPAQISKDEIEGFFVAAQAMCKAIDVSWGIVFDLSRFSSQSQAGNRSAFANGVNSLNDVLGYLAGAAIVVPSPVARGMATAVIWVINKPYKTKMFGRLEPAKQWVAAQISARS